MLQEKRLSPLKGYNAGEGCEKQLADDYDLQDYEQVQHHFESQRNDQEAAASVINKSVCSPSNTYKVEMIKDDNQTGSRLNQNENNKKRKPGLKYSESLTNLMESSALKNTVEMCEVFVIIGVHEQSIQNTLSNQSKNQDGGFEMIQENLHQNESIIERPSMTGQLPDSVLKCSAQILDSYPRIFKNENDVDSIANSDPNDPSSIQKIMGMIKEQYLYLSNIELICFPEGFYVDTEFRRHKLFDVQGRSSYHPNQTGNTTNSNQYKIMHFTITQSSGEKKYLTSLEYKEIALIKYYENHVEEKKLCIVPKCLCIVSRLPVFSIQKQMLEYIYDDIVKKYHQSFLDDCEDADDFLQIERKLNITKVLVKADRLEFYLSTFFHHLNIDGSNLEVEIYKKFSDSCTGSWQKRTLVRFVNTFNKECLRLENYDFRLLFQKVRPKMLMQMFVSLLHERKIILIHNECSKNALLIEALISLLYPLQWNFTNISYLIPSMVEYLEAPFPYIVGVPRDLWKYIYEQKWDILGEEVVAFDLDNQRFYVKEELPQFPQPYTQLLIKQLEIQLEKSKQVGVASARGSPEEAQREEDKFWNNFTLKVKQQFLNFLIFLINTFENFYVTNQKETPIKQLLNPMISIGNQQTAPSTIDSSTLGDSNKHSIIGGANGFGGGSANDIFNFEEYVQNVRENQPFFEKFVRTQAFINFIEQAFYEEQGNLSDASIRFFKECTRKLSNENIQTVRAMQDSIIQSLMHKFNNRGISYSIDKCHLIYEKQLNLANPTLVRQSASKSLGGISNNSQFLIYKLEHQKIIKMKAFDPKPLIEQKYVQVQESIYDIQHALEKSNKKPKPNRREILKEFNIIDQQLCSINYQIKPNNGHLADFFTVQATPTGVGTKILVNEETEAKLNINNLNKTTELIKIEDNHDELSNNSQLHNYNPINEVDEQNSSDEKGFLGFFKKTFSSVKKTFENTFNNNNEKKKGSKSQTRKEGNVRFLQGSRTPLYENENEQLDESPKSARLQRNTQQNNINRAVRSQTFHAETRDRKNNDSFFAKVFNLGSNYKDKYLNIQQSSSLSPRKEIMSHTIDSQNRRKLNGSGFFVFNEDDMKKMTEMSPKQSKTNIRSASFNFDLQAIEGQLTQRQIPQIKATSIFNNVQNSQHLSNRIRSISHQQQNSSSLGSGVKQVKQIDLINESINQSSIKEETQNQLVRQFDFKGVNAFSIPNSVRKSPGESRINQNFEQRNACQTSEIAPDQLVLMKQFNDFQIKSFTNSPYISTQQSAVKEGYPSKQEFEEIYKKSTKNLFYAPINRSVDGNGFKQQKYNIWRSQGGIVDFKVNPESQKPPKHHQNVNPRRSREQKTYKLQNENGHYSQSQQARFQINDNPNLNNVIIPKIEENKVFQKNQEGIYSDKNSTDEDHRAPITGKNVSQFKKMIQSKRFDKNSPILNQDKRMPSQIQSANNKHKRQITGGTSNFDIKGDAVHSLNSPLLENIEPDDDNKASQNALHKQIESMQIGRVRKKSNKKLGQPNAVSKIQSRKNSHLNSQSSNKPTSRTGVQSSNYQASQANDQNNQRYINQKTYKYQTRQPSGYSQTSIQQRQRSNTQSSKKQSESQTNGKPEENASLINKNSNYKIVPPKILQSSSYSSTKSINFSASNDSQNLPHKNIQKIAQQNNQVNLSIQCETIKQMQLSETSNVHSSNYIVRKQNELAEDSKLDLNNDDSYLSSQSQSEVVFKPSKINIINQSLDFRDAKKGESLRLRSYARVISPASNQKNQQCTGDSVFKFTPSAGIGNHSLSFYADPHQKPPMIGQHDSHLQNQYQKHMQNDDFVIKHFIQSNSKVVDSDSLSKLSAYRSTLKPLNKITWDGFNQIAKLSGDVDHEPNTPKSGNNISDTDID